VLSGNSLNGTILPDHASSRSARSFGRFLLFAPPPFWYKGPIPRDRRPDVTRLIDYMVYNVFEPSLNWVLSHPIISVLAVGALIFFSVRNYRML
jgi:hypothetical protein